MVSCLSKTNAFKKAFALIAVLTVAMVLLSGRSASAKDRFWDCDNTKKAFTSHLKFAKKIATCLRNARRFCEKNKINPQLCFKELDIRARRNEKRLPSDCFEFQRNLEQTNLKYSYEVPLFELPDEKECSDARKAAVCAYNQVKEKSADAKYQFDFKKCAVADNSLSKFVPFVPFKVNGGRAPNPKHAP